MLQRHCPHIGLRSDPASIFAEPTEEHLCRAARGGQRIDLAYQTAVCLTSNFEACPRLASFEPDPSPRPLLFRLLRFLRETPKLVLGAWVTLAVMGIMVILYAYLIRPMPGSALPTEASSVAVTPSPSPSPTQPLAESPQAESGVEAPAVSATATVVPSTPTPDLAAATFAPGKLQAVLVPSGNAVGWVSSGERLNHFGNRNIHVGVFEGHVYHGAMQLNLSSIPLGSTIEHATVELMGLNAETLELEAGSTWALRLLSPEADENWSSATYEQIHEARVADTIAPELGAQDLAVRQVNVFTFTPAQCAELERRLEGGPDGPHPLVSFRLDGPSQGVNNLVTWDTGYGGGFGSRPVLRVIYQPPPTPTPMVVTVAPSPANVLTAAAVAATATYQAVVEGTPTPLPPNVVTATPPFIITHTPTPENAATATFLVAAATAQAFLYGTPTPLPADAWTATPGPTPTSTATPGPTPTSTATPGPTPTSTPTYVIIGILSTPTPENILTVAALVAAAEIQAATAGTPTPWPPNWVTPIIVTNTPTPESAATATFLAAAATARAFLYGTPTPRPPNVWTATPVPTSTPVPLLIPVSQITPASPTPTQTPTPSEFPRGVRGKIAFRSDRFGGQHILVMDPDGSNVALLTDPWVYEAALAQEPLSPDGRFLVYQGEGRHGVDLFLHDLLHGVHGQLTYVGMGFCYDAAWSPDNMHIVFASNQEGDDEIYVVTRDGGPTRQLTHNSWEWDKHPRYSPQGGRIVYSSNAVTSHMQIWVMNADGSGKHNISSGLGQSGNSHHDWDPVWIK